MKKENNKASVSPVEAVNPSPIQQAVDAEFQQCRQAEGEDYLSCLQKARTKLLLSVAEEQKAVAMLLSAQAEKLSKLGDQATTGEIQQANASLQSSIQKVIDLEYVLLEKIQLALGQCLL